MRIIAINTLKAHNDLLGLNLAACENQIKHYILELVRNAVVSNTLRKNRVLGMDNLDSNMVPIVAISFLFTSEFMPPIETISAYAAASLVPSNDIGTDDFSMTITNCTILYIHITDKKKVTTLRAT